MGKITSFRESGQRYVILRIVGFFCILTGTILLAIGVWLLIAAIRALATSGGAAVPSPNPAPFPGPQLTTFPLPLPAGFSLLWASAILFSGLQQIALGAFFGLMIHLEENTRASAQVLDKLRSRMEANEAMGPLFRS